MSQARCDGFEHGTTLYFGTDATKTWLDTTGSPAVDAAYALTGTYGARVGQGGQVDQYWRMPTSDVLDGVCQHCLDFGIMVKSHSLDDGNVQIILSIDSGASSAGGPLHIRRESGPVYYFRHAATNIYQLTIDTEYRVRFYSLADGTNYHTWVWIYDAANNLLAHSYYAQAEADTKINLFVGCYGAAAAKIDFDAYIDHIVWAGSEDSTTYDCPYWTLKPGIYVGSPNADDATENDYDADDEQDGATVDTWDHVDEIPPAVADYAIYNVDGALQLWTTDIAEPVGYMPLSVGLGEAFKFVPTATPNAFHHFRIKSGANVSEESEPLDTATRYRAKWFQADPGGGAWTPALVNALLIGMRYEQGDAAKVHLVYHAIIQVPCVTLDTPPSVAAAVPIFSKDGIHSLVFGGQVITGGA